MKKVYSEPDFEVWKLSVLDVITVDGASGNIGDVDSFVGDEDEF